jgi:regulator of replication initiation timing
MSNQNQAPKDKRTVGQKIDDLEAAMINAYQMMNNMAADIAASKESSHLLGMKTEAIISLLASGSAVTSESVVESVQSQRAQRMADDVSNLVAQGVLTASDAVSERSFVVARDLDKDGSGKVVNPRLQFVVNNLDEETKAKLLGAAPGTIISTEGKNQLEILEVYAIGRPEAPAEETPAAESSEEAPSEAASS